MNTILIVDDDRNMLKILKLIFERARYRVLTAVDSRSTLALIKQDRPDILLIDDVLPGMSGSQLCFHLKHNSYTRAIPIVLFTGWWNTLDANLTHVDAMLRKPTHPHLLLETIEGCLHVKV